MEPKAEEPKADPSVEPKAEEPKAEPAQAEEPQADPSVEPQAEEPQADPSVEPQAEEPQADPSVEPQAEEPQADPSVEPQAVEPQADPSVEPQAVEPQADPSVEPQADPSVEPQADPATEPTNKPASRAATAGTPILLAANPNVAIDARLRDHVGVNNGTTGNCIRYSPADGNQTDWVSNPQTAWAAHGSPVGGSCPSSLNTATQSAIGFQPSPAASVPTGTPFLLGRMTHNNNPINVSDQYFTGKLDVRLAGETLEFPWTLNETPNSSSPQSNPNNDDFTNFTSQIDDTEITIDGLKYKLVVLGFTQNTGSSCPAAPAGAYVNEFRTTEGTQTYGCLYAELAQVRKLTIEKVAIVGESPFPNFGFSSTSNLAGSPWSAWSDSLKPTATGPAGADSSAQQDFLPSEEDVVVTEAAVNGWALDSVVCKDGTGQNVSGINVNLSDRRVTLNNVPDADTNAAAPITCTFNNKPRTGTLTLVKTVVNDNGGSATTADFQAKINGDNVDWGVAVTLPVGDYTASEVALAGGAGYTAGPWGGACAANGTVTIGNGQDKTCTITNDDMAATLIVRKVVVNDDGGTLAAADFTFVVDGGAPVSFEADGQNDLSVDAGTYTVTEPAVAGYATSYDNCSQVVIPNGGTATCTITNDDMAATLIVRKVVVNDDGGTLAAADFTFVVDGGAPVSFEADGQNDLSVDAGTYTVTEPAVAGYATSYDNCSQVVIPNGGTATCTITNDDMAATLIVRKVVVNDDGGTLAAADFTFVVDGGAPVSFEADGQNDLSVDAGTYTVTEPAVAGYATSYDNCSQVVIPNGGTATCTITNDDMAATLIVRKVVVNDDGGTLAAADFTFVVDGGAPVSFEADGQNDLSVDAGTYTVTEPAVAGYATSYDNCSQVVIPNGGTATCTITNDDMAATLIVRKVVVNDDGGTLAAADFTFVVDGGAPVSFEADGQNDLSVDAGTYTVTEPAVAGYATSYDNCSQVVIPNGGTATCTITNDDMAGTITLNKTVSGGDAALTDFVPSISGTQVTWGVAVELPAGSYTASEVMNVSDYVAGQWGGDCDAQGNVDLALGENLTCTITNFYAELTIEKSADPAFYAKEGDIIGYTVTATNSGMATLTNVDVSDALVDSLDSWTCDPGDPGHACARPVDHLHGRVRDHRGGRGGGLCPQHRVRQQRRDLAGRLRRRDRPSVRAGHREVRQCGLLHRGRRSGHLHRHGYQHR